MIFGTKAVTYPDEIRIAVIDCQVDKETPIHLAIDWLN